MIKQAAADVVIFGGGIAGLWLLHQLRQTGLSVVLFESSALGGGQTMQSQGIIHGGMKYALQGVLTKDAAAMSDMPDLWQACLSGRGEIDLKNVPILSPHQYLWSPNKFAAKLTGLMASATLQSRVSPVAKSAYPALFQNPRFKGELYALNEMVIDVPALVRELVRLNSDAVFRIEPLNEEELHFTAAGNLTGATVYTAGQALNIQAQRFIFTAGAGNEIITKNLTKKDIAMQLRPLHMLMVKMPVYHHVYAHCLGFGTKPRLTITTHRCSDGNSIWYLGGALAEDGVKLSSEGLINQGKKELKDLFPWVDFSQADYASFRVDRAEPKQKSGAKPESIFFEECQHAIVAWPTKLALAPKLAAEILQRLAQQELKPQLADLRELRAWPMPPVAVPKWESEFAKA